MGKQIIRPFNILGTGIYLPGGAPIDSETLETRFGLPRGWARRYSGVERRYWAAGETGTDMAVAALQNALDRAGLDYSDLDLLVSASATYDYPIPHNACLIQERMGGGERPVPGFDIDATCLGGIVALDVCAHLLDGRRYRKIAMVCSEIASKSLNPEDKETLTLLGDAAVAVIIGVPEPGDENPGGLIHADLATWPHAARYNMVRAGGNVLPGGEYTAEKSHFYFQMEGIKLLRLAMEKIPEFADRFFADAGVTREKIAHFIPHQASLAGLLTAQKVLGIEPGQMVVNLPEYGNTLSSSTGLALHEALESGRIKKGDYVVMMGTGAGFSIGGVMFKY